MKDQIEYKFPILTIKEVKHLLRKNERVFAYAIKATTEKADVLTLYENKGLDLSNYVGQKMECLLEITKGEFEYKDKEGNIPENTISLKYQWLKRPYEFFPELDRMKDDLREANSSEEKSLQVLFETTATKFFEEWGLNGLNIGIYQDKPLLSNADGIFLLNEYEFEEEIDSLELNEEVYIRIDEMFLRGIRPCISSFDSKQKQVFVQQKKQENIIQPKPEEEPKEPPKKRSGFFLD